MGSIREARRAGTKHVSAATAMRTTEYHRGNRGVIGAEAAVPALAMSLELAPSGVRETVILGPASGGKDASEASGTGRIR